VTEASGTEARPTAELRRATLLSMLSLGLVGLLLAGTLGGPGYFLQLGQTSDSLELAREVLGAEVPVPLKVGHDGERFWLLARDPLLLGGESLATDLDRPSYRAQRIGYPLLAAPWRLGGEQSLLWGLFVTNVIVVGLGALATGALASDRGGSALLAYAFAANPLVWLALLFDLSDAVALAALMGTIWAASRARKGITAGLGVVAVLARETSLAGLAAAALLGAGLQRRIRFLMVVPGLLVGAAWRLYVVTRPGFGNETGSREFSLVPFSGYLDVWSHGLPSTSDWVYLIITIGLLAFSTFVVAMWRRDKRDVLLCAALPYAVAMPFLAPIVIDVPVNSARVIGPAVTLVAVYLMTRSPAEQGEATVVQAAA
jgi:hypothetical protein